MGDDEGVTVGIVVETMVVPRLVGEDVMATLLGLGTGPLFWIMDGGFCWTVTFTLEFGGISTTTGLPGCRTTD